MSWSKPSSRGRIWFSPFLSMQISSLVKFLASYIARQQWDTACRMNGMQNRGLAILFKSMSRVFFWKRTLELFPLRRIPETAMSFERKIRLPINAILSHFLWISKRRAHIRLSCHFENRNVILFSDMNWQKIASFLLIWARFCDHDKILPIKRNRRNEMNDRE